MTDATSLGAPAPMGALARGRCPGSRSAARWPAPRWSASRWSASRRPASQLAACLLAAVATLLLAAPTVDAEPKPLWEFGMGIGALGFADYRGADSSHLYPVPVPYFVYRGKFLEADRNGVRGKLFDQDRVQLNISANATTPVRNNSARSGMPDLRPTVEIGPSLEMHVWRSADEKVRLDIRTPARAAFTVESHPHYIGWFFAPNIALDLADAAGFKGWNLGLLTGPLFATRRYDDYFYTVAPAFATSTRPAYQAQGGYGGTQFIASLTKRFPSYWAGAFVRYDTLAGASFEPSPLVRRTSYWTAGFGVAWMIKQSSRMVETDE